MTELVHSQLASAARRPRFSVCIPAYNRVRYLPGVLDSVYAQAGQDFEVVLCEDASAERKQIAAVAEEYAREYPGTLRYFENEDTLGYDGNIRRLVELARGEYCFFLGNDDLLCPGALAAVSSVLDRHANVGMVLKSYAWFVESPESPKEVIRYFQREQRFAAGAEALRVCFRRSGVISGYVVHRDCAAAAATEQFDGTLYYQMHLTASVLQERCAVFTPQVLVLCRGGEVPEFGASGTERGRFVPGRYTPEARLRMVAGALDIVKHLRDSSGIDVVDDVMRDYANHLYPYVKDQLSLPLRDYGALYRGYARLGLGRYPMFHVYCLAAYALGPAACDRFLFWYRAKVNPSPRLGLRGFPSV